MRCLIVNGYKEVTFLKRERQIYVKKSKNQRLVENFGLAKILFLQAEFGQLSVVIRGVSCGILEWVS
jgi:hypothetical protein